MEGKEEVADARERPWPHCEAIGGRCLAYDVGCLLGLGIATAVSDFILTAQEGARLTLQRNQEGFTLQVTGAVQKGAGDGLDLAKVKELRRRLERLASPGGE